MEKAFFANRLGGDRGSRFPDWTKAVFAAALLVLFWFLRHALLLIWVSVIFAVLFTPAVNWIQRFRLRRWHPGQGTALLILICAVVVAFGIFGFFALPPIISDARALATELPSNIGQLQDKVRQLPFGHEIAGRLQSSQFQHRLGTILTGASSVAQSVKATVTGLFTVLLLTAYFILDGKRAFLWTLAFFPESSRERVRQTALRAGGTAQQWLVGQLILMAILGGSTTLVLALLGVRYFYVLGVFAAVANFVPVLGPILTVVVAGAIAAIDSWTKVLGVVIFYFIYQQVENALLTPKIVGSKVGLPGVSVLIALVVGAEVAGLVGALVAVPTAVVVTAFVDEFLHQNHAEEEPKPRAA